MTLLAALVLAATWPAPGAKVHASIAGKFDARAPFDVNLVNGPPVGGPVEPPPLAIPTEVIDALNAGASQALDGVLTSLGFVVVHGPNELTRLQTGAKLLGAGDDDRRFALELRIAGENGLGGHRGGLQLSVFVRSLNRSRDLVGQGASTVPVAHDTDAALLGLRGALMDAVSTALVDLRGHLHDDEVRPRVHVLLRVQTSNLAPLEQAAAAKILGCAAALAELLGTTPVDGGPGALSADLELRLKRFDPDETLSSLVHGYAGVLELEAGPNGKSRCSTWQTPLEGRLPVVTTAPGEVRLRFDLPDGG